MKSKKDTPKKEEKKSEKVSEWVQTELGEMHRDFYEFVFNGGNSEF